MNEAPQLKPRSDTLYRRLTVVMVVAVVISMCTFAYTAVKNFRTDQYSTPPQEVTVGTIQTFISTSLPPWSLVALAGMSIILLATVAVAFEVIATLLSVNPKRAHISSHRPPLRTAESGKVKVTMLIPAHNEEVTLPETLQMLTFAETAGQNCLFWNFGELLTRVSGGC